MSDPILLQRDGAVARVLLNRPDKLNAFTLAMWRHLGRVMTEVNGDETLRCVVLSGAGGKAFGAGADIAEFETVRANAAQAEAYGHHVDVAMEAVANCPHPTLAAIQGPCVGGGLELALQCDLRICAEGARFGIPINRIGHCLPLPGMRALVELAGRPTAMEILLEGRILDAPDAATRGLVNRVVSEADYEAEIDKAVARIAGGAPLAARAHKRFAQRALDPRPFTDEELRQPYQACDSADYREGVRAFMAKETPRFGGV